ncbi:MAG: alpha/beta hydrolase [Nanoarchaeota archaeon]
MKRFFIVHRWDGYPGGDWYPWLKEQLEKKGFFVEILDMPDASSPSVFEWTEYIREAIGTCDENTFLIGHSIGCQAILRCLDKLPPGENIGGAVFVAGWFTLMGLESEEEKVIARPWLEIPIDFNKVREHLGKSIALFSDNDPFVPINNINLFKERIGSETIMEQGMKHFTELDGVIELPAVLDAVLKISDDSR